MLTGQTVREWFIKSQKPTKEAKQAETTKLYDDAFDPYGIRIWCVWNCGWKIWHESRQHASCHIQNTMSVLILSTLICITQKGVELSCHSTNGTLFLALFVDNHPESFNGSVAVVIRRPESAQSASLTIAKYVLFDHSHNSWTNIQYSKLWNCDFRVLHVLHE